MKPPILLKPPPAGSRKKIFNLVKEKDLLLCLILMRHGLWRQEASINRMPGLILDIRDVKGQIRTLSYENV